MNLHAYFIKSFLAVVFINLFFSLSVLSQNVAVTDNEAYEADSSAMLDVQSTTKGMLVPRMTTLERTAINKPANGLLVYDTNFDAFYYSAQKKWVRLMETVDSTIAGGPLFHVTNSLGDTVFAVYENGVEILVNTQAKGFAGGFAVSGRSTGKQIPVDYLRVTPDSTRVYVNDDNTKGIAGGFAVSGRSTAKGDQVQRMLMATPDSTRIYVNADTTSKGIAGGFAVSGRSTGKESVSNFLNVTPDNYFIGHKAGKSNQTGLHNSFMGFEAGFSNKSGNENIFIGYQAGRANTGGGLNTFLGYQAGANNTGNDNTFIGHKAGNAHDNKGGNVHIGSKAGEFATDGEQNVFIGESTGANTTYGSQNVFMGFEAGYNNTGDPDDAERGSYNVYIGHEAGREGMEAKKNVFLGYQAGRNAENNNHTSWFGGLNVFIGNQSGFFNTIGGQNIAIGDEAFRSNTEGNYNVAIGKEALYSNPSGDDNIALGKISMREVVSGSNGNIAIGKQALYGDSTSSINYNIAIGLSALYNNTGLGNVGIGSNALAQLGGGDNNTAIGRHTNVDPLHSTFSNSSVIGYDADITASNQVRLGNDQITSFFCQGAYAATTSNPANLYVSANGQILRSTAKFKYDESRQQNVNKLNGALEKLMNIRGVTFQLKDSPGKTNIGVVAQEVAKIVPEAVYPSVQEKGSQSLDSNALIALVIEALKEQQKEIQRLQAQNKELKSKLEQIEELKADNAELKRLIMDISEKLEQGN